MNFIRNVKALVYVLVLMANLSFAQTKVIDSLRNELHNTPEKDRWPLYVDLGYELLTIAPVEAKKFALKSYELSLANHDSVSLIGSRTLIAVLLRDEDSDSSLVMGLRTLAMAEKCQLNRVVYQSMNRIALNYLFRGKYDLALHFLLKAIDLPYAKGNRRANKILWNNLGLLYYKIRYYEKAISAYGESLNYADSIAEPGLVAETLFNMSLCESSLGNFQKSKACIARALKVCPNECNDGEGVQYYSSLATFQFWQGNYDSVIYFTNCAYNLAFKYRDRRMQASSLEMKAKAYLKMDSVHLAETTILKAKSIVLGSELHAEIRDVHAVLAKIAERKGDYKTMAMALKKYTEELDSTEASASRINIMKLEVDLKEREHREQLVVQEMYAKTKEDVISAQRLLIIASGVICCLFAVILVILFKRHMQKTNQNKLLDKNLQLRTHELQHKVSSSIKVQSFQKEVIDKMLLDIDHQLRSMKILLKYIASDETQKNVCVKKSQVLFERIDTSIRKIKSVVVERY
ncbi:tetratricopeptide repeat protein [Pseudochryseolinea flava]|uniref:Tetratricopeptide repeat protein n=1 Tax=Pseudochryseolinea flava TaxID=2059302 RepID=A0A364Y469_9BACT|nr:tetratricopeptide repeat protein [Pseudochryseolinea flava]RAW01657.1 hypothetical protein DQQ10_08360 [Pseudochryseolinea flava]